MPRTEDAGWARYVERLSSWRWEIIWGQMRPLVKKITFSTPDLSLYSKKDSQLSEVTKVLQFWVHNNIIYLYLLFSWHLHNHWFLLVVWLCPYKVPWSDFGKRDHFSTKTEYVYYFISSNTITIILLSIKKYVIKC